MSHAAPAKAAPPPAAANSAPAGQVIDPIVATAERIFIEFASRVLANNNGVPKLGIDGAALATLAFEASQSFHAVELARRPKAELTTATFDASMCDFDSWSKEAQG
jgi:hypothetical protein